MLKSAIQERLEVNMRNGIEIDESYFGPTRVRGKRGRGTGSKVIIFGLLKRGDNIHTEIVNSAKSKELLPIIKKVVGARSDIYTDGWRSYNAITIYGYNHKKVKHHENEFVRERKVHINGVESFWSCTKRRLDKFSGISKRSFKVYLLESEWRFNHRKNLSKNFKILIRNFNIKCFTE
jgi:transposase-like protein